jgi:hypothetical protein
MTSRAFWISIAALYSAALIGVLAKVGHDGFVFNNVYQVIVIALWPLIYGALPIVLAAIWLLIMRFNLSRAWTGLQILAVVYAVNVFFRLLRSLPL